MQEVVVDLPAIEKRIAKDNTTSNPVHTCRICLEEDDRCVRACQCTDHVHRECLNRWRNTKVMNSYVIPLYGNFAATTHCEVCREPYKYRIDTDSIRNDVQIISNVKNKYFFKIAVDVVVLFAILFGFYMLCGWYLPPVWRVPEPTDGHRLANGMIYTHAMIAVVMVIMSILQSSSSSSSGCYFCCYCASAPDCDGGRNTPAIMFIICICLAVIGFAFTFCFIIQDVVMKRWTQMKAEIYVKTMNVN